MLAGGRLATGVLEITDDVSALDHGGFWAVAIDFEGTARCIRFARVAPAPPAAALAVAPWMGPTPDAWVSTMGRAAYTAGVRRIRAEIAAGEVYQVNLCRTLSARLPAGPATHPASGSDPLALAALLERANPAPHAVVIDVAEADLHVVSASPELFLSRRGDAVESGPIKGTGRTAADLRDKDVAENVMIVDLVRNDLGRVARPGTVTVPSLCALEAHPGLVHLVSTVRARLAPGVGWARLLAATCPPGSVSGAPKSSALRIIRQLEPAPRGIYCGAVGWVDAGRATASLSVGIRTFRIAGDVLTFGTGAGITYGSDPEREWDETALKSERLVGLASTGHPAATGQVSGPLHSSSASSASRSMASPSPPMGTAE
jgi:para-aminobenzoate synthetase component I